MIILGIDPATKTGWARFDTTGPVQAIMAGVLKAEGESHEQKAASLGRSLVALIKRIGRPDMIALEMPMRSAPAARRSNAKFMGEEGEEQTGVAGLTALIVTNQMVGALMGVIGAYGIPFEVMAPTTWRTAFLGYGRQAGFQRKDWKAAVRNQCDMEGIVVTNDDMADAVGLAIAGRNTQTARLIASRKAAA